MSCNVCEGLGLVKVCYSDDPAPLETFEVAICLCDVGQRMRKARNGPKATGFPLWKVWAAKNGVDESLVLKLEDVCGPSELNEMFPRGVLTRRPVEDIVQAGQTRRPRM
jgi:hypothetical protein